MDVHDKKTRSFNMSKIGSKNTNIELIVRKYLFKNGFRYRLHYSKIPGKPDIVFPKNKLAIFINGCYFHRHENCKLATTSETRIDFWKKKIDGNVIRDKKIEEILKELKWTIINIWECELEPRKKNSKLREETLENLKNKILKLVN
jgi:DNA mismatch endonuclease, patch repair protein